MIEIFFPKENSKNFCLFISLRIKYYHFYLKIPDDILLELRLIKRNNDTDNE